MMRMTCRLLLASLSFSAVSAQNASLGLFTHAGDVGNPAIKGAAVYNASTGEFRITGSGENMWAKQDQFQFVWKEMTGNFTVNATVHFLGEGAEHRKAGIVVRQNLDSDAAYADVVVHGNGMPSLQWRNRKGEDTFTLDRPFDKPGTFKIRLVRQGVRIFMYVGKDGAEPEEIVHTEVAFQPQTPVLVGLAVCSHDPAVSETAVFSDVSIEVPPPQRGAPPKKQ
jgi:regulation of enolase protein 1 (concanavalin A-like superfamily)